MEHNSPFPRLNFARYLTSDFKYQAVQYYQHILSQQRTADRFNISRTRLRLWIVAHNQSGIRALGHPQANMTIKRKNPFIVDKPDYEKMQAKLIEELRYMRVQNNSLKE